MNLTQLTEHAAFRTTCLFVATAMAVWLFVGAAPSHQPDWLRAPFDKLAHFLYFATMASLTLLGTGARRLWLPLLLLPLIGGLDEWHQSTVEGRFPSVWDWCADFAGCLAATFVFRRRKSRGTTR